MHSQQRQQKQQHAETIVYIIPYHSRQSHIHKRTQKRTQHSIIPTNTRTHTRNMLHTYTNTIHVNCVPSPFVHTNAHIASGARLRSHYSGSWMHVGHPDDNGNGRLRTTASIEPRCRLRRRQTLRLKNVLHSMLCCVVEESLDTHRAHTYNIYNTPAISYVSNVHTNSGFMRVCWWCSEYYYTTAHSRHTHTFTHSHTHRYPRWNVRMHSICCRMESYIYICIVRTVCTKLNAGRQTDGVQFV